MRFTLIQLRLELAQRSMSIINKERKADLVNRIVKHGQMII